MKKQSRVIQGICCAMVFLFVCGALVPACSAHISTPQANGEKTSPESSVKKVKHTNNDDEDFFNFAIIWGPFEVKYWSSLFQTLVVYNRAPWYNRTINVIGYQPFEHNWVFKKSCWIECGYLHIGFVGRHWLFVIGYGNIAAF
ncbi:MAG: hypothetical protein IMZ43_05240 [Thermoplasmata archaeon]|nr:hypothetical protein [Thermoplasmata archaeon]